MVKWLGALVASLCILAAAPQERKKLKPAEIEVVEIHFVRNVDKIQIDGKVKNSGDAPARELQFIFYFISPDNKTVSTRRAPIDTKLLEAGEEAEFTLETVAPVRAALVRLEAVEKGERFLKMSKEGPFPIE